MRIAHVCLSNLFVDGRLYQENELVRQHHVDGHDVLVVASPETQSADGHVTYVEPGEYVAPEGVPVVRLPYTPRHPAFLARKLRIHRGLRDRLDRFAPHVIMFHGLCGAELLTVARYARDHPETVLYADSHTDWNNSARSFFSREVLHKLYYRPILRRALPQIRRILCISEEVMEFASDVYGIPADELEFFPLGGRPVSQSDYQIRRRRGRDRLGLSDDQILFVQSGRQTVRKRLIESLRAFKATEDPRFRLVVAGSLFDDIRDRAERMISADERVTFLGWQSSEALTDLLCAAEVYLQPGTQSVTMQQSLCARCAIIIDDVPSHQVYHRENGWLLGEGMSLVGVLGSISAQPDLLPSMQEASYRLAREVLDYRQLAQRVLS